MRMATLYRTTLVAFASLFMAGCEAIASIFQAGFWVGAIIVLIVIGIIGWFVSRGRGAA
jgi:hypothetical protein